VVCAKLTAVPTKLDRIAVDQAKMELFAHGLYNALADRLPSGQNRETLTELAEHERGHVDFWLGVGNIPEGRVRPSRIKHHLLLWASRVLGIAFTIRWLEKGEQKAIETYRELLDDGLLTPEQTERVRRILHEEEEHEQALEGHVTDDRRLYLGAAVLGLNDALVELTGGLTGLVSSIANPKLIGFAGLVIGISASMAMAASNFLSVDIGEQRELNPRKAAAYTGVAYLLVVLALVMSFFFVADRRVALAITWVVAVLVIAGFSYYSSVMQGSSFWRRFGVMCALGLGVGVVSFGIGRAVGSVLGIEL
jgi:VIT1/CCC1 family predicted Fe2+/Mn2+ transporter